MRELREKLAELAGDALSDDVLDQIRLSLLGSEGATKVPLTVKYSFESKEDGELSVHVESKCNLALMRQRVHLVHRRGQLELEFAPVATKEAPVPKAEKPNPKKAAAPGGEGYGEARLAEIKRQSVELYRNGNISRGLAIAAGVDVEAVDNEKSEDHSLKIEGLSLEERKALESSLT